ncbi:hypothetical protein LTR97_001488 [Elasticomyces elasticus]|uniref:Uncharacterized protein n=1 Tax=Elasticomyces elasticus TaxID=574655 RepID=A0AAN7WBM8_9PEZI|nr:hypothetical protein LTR97_001488 [Elasticomyces elasticus]
MASHRQAQAKNRRSNTRLARTNNSETLKESKGDKKAVKRWRRKIGNSANAIPVTGGSRKGRPVALANEVAQLRELGRGLQLSSPRTSSDHEEEEEETEDPLRPLLDRMPQALHNFMIERLQPMFDDDLSNSDLAQRIHDVATSLETPFAPPQQRIPVQASGVVSPPNHRATCTARTFLHQSFYQPFQSYAHDAQMLHIIATDTQNCSPFPLRTRDQPSNPPQTQTNLDQCQNYEPRIPPQPTFNPPSTPRRRFKKKVESEEQTSKRSGSTVPAGEEWKDAVLISSDNASPKRPVDAISISSGVTPSSPYKSSSPPRNDCGSAQTQVVDCGGEAQLPQAAASRLPQKKVRWGVPLTYVRIFVPDVEEELVDEEESTEDELDELPDMEEELTEDELDELADEELHESLLMDIYMAEQDADDDQQQLNQPSSPDISQTHRRQSTQPSSVSQDFGCGSQSKYPQEPSAVQDALASSDSYYADRSQSPQPSSASQDTSHAQLSQNPQVPLRNQDALAAPDTARAHLQDTSHAQLSQNPQVPLRNQDALAALDTACAHLSQSPQAPSASQDTSHAQLSQNPQVPLASQDIQHAQLSRSPRNPPSSPEFTLKLCLPSDSVMPWELRWSDTDQRNRHYQADRSESAQSSPVAPTNHGPASLLPLLPLQNPSVQLGVAAFTSGGRNDAAPPQPSQSPRANLDFGPSSGLSVRAMRERHRAGDDAVRQWIYDEFDRLVEMGDELCGDGGHE